MRVAMKVLFGHILRDMCQDWQDKACATARPASETWTHTYTGKKGGGKTHTTIMFGAMLAKLLAAMFCAWGTFVWATLGDTLLLTRLIMPAAPWRIATRGHWLLLVLL